MHVSVDVPVPSKATKKVASYIATCNCFESNQISMARLLSSAIDSACLPSF